jgi:hypothetical protein
MTEMQSSTVPSCWAVTKERRETGSELWTGCGNSTVISINCFLETALPNVVCILLLISDIYRLIGFCMTLVYCFGYGMPTEVIIL